MLFHRSKAKQSCRFPHSAGSVIVHVLSALLLLIALVGVYLAHVRDIGLVFGTPEGSLSIMALVAVLFLIIKLQVSAVCCLPETKKKK